MKIILFSILTMKTLFFILSKPPSYPSEWKYGKHPTKVLYPLIIILHCNAIVKLFTIISLKVFLKESI